MAILGIFFALSDIIAVVSNPSTAHGVYSLIQLIGSLVETPTLQTGVDKETCKICNAEKSQAIHTVYNLNMSVNIVMINAPSSPLAWVLM